MIMLNSFERTPTLAELKVSYRRGRARASKSAAPTVRLSSSIAAEKYLRAVWDKNTLELREEFLLVCVNTAHEVLGWVRLATGGIDAAFIDPRLVFGVALQTAAAGILIAHNHPSGSSAPSDQDRALTRRLRQGAALLNIKLLDHIILTRDGALSFAREGFLND